MAGKDAAAISPVEKLDRTMAQREAMMSQFNSQFSALADLATDAQPKQTVLQRRVDGIEEDHESGGVRWSGVIESEGTPVRDRATQVHLEADDEGAKASREP